MNAGIQPQETGVWTIISGNGQFSDIHSPTSFVSGLSPGENNFLWTVGTGGCIAADEIKITVEDLFIPSVITPDGDGKNDVFRINAINGRTGLIILNRWGNVEYSDVNYSNDWSGKNNRGDALPEDTYFYIVTFENGLIKKGTVLIIR
jgi:gliding motility-associated-like protein